MKHTTMRAHIRRLITRHGSIRAAARATGVEPSYFYRLAQGYKTNPSNHTLKRLGLRQLPLPAIYEVRR